MTELSSINSPTAIQQLLNTPNAEAQEDREALGKDAFLRLMIAQLNNQDPLSPQENGEFVAQLAQFSSVEGIDNLNNSFSSFANNMSASQALQASTLVGRDVQVLSNSSYFDSSAGLMNGQVSLGVSSPQVDVRIYDQSGALVKKLALGEQAAGDIGFSWNGLDENGAGLADGVYFVRAEAVVDGQMQEMPTYLSTRVNSVTLGSANDVNLNLDNGLSLPLSEVKTIN